MVWCLGMSEHGNSSEHPLKLKEWCLGVRALEWLGASTLIDGVVSGHVRALEWLGASTLIDGVVSGHVRALKWLGASA
jgi:hypothetical protein